MTAPLKLGLLISADASQVAPATAAARKEVESVGRSARTAAGGLEQLSAADREAAAAAKQAIDAAMGQAAAERNLAGAINARLGIGRNVGQVGTPFAGDALRGDDIAAYGAQLDALRAKYDPVFAASKRYEVELEELNRAHRVGAINERQHGVALEALNARYTAAATMAGRFGTVMRGTAFETANIAAQFQDIGISLAAGMSPFQVALQQGTQLSLVFDQLKRSGQGLGTALLGAFTSLISPVSLVTIGLIAAGGAAYQYFTTVDDGSDGSQTALKAEADLVQRVAKQWGDALPSIKAYADERQRIADLGEVKEATESFISHAWESIKGTVGGWLDQSPIGQMRVEMADLVDMLNGAGVDQNVIVELQRSFQDVIGEIEDGTVETAQLERVSEALSTLYRQTSIPAVKTLADEFGRLASNAAEASAKTKAARAEQRALESFEQHGGTILNRRMDRTSLLPQIDPLGFIDPNRDQTNRAAATKSLYEREQERLASRHSRSQADILKQSYDSITLSARQSIEMTRLHAQALGLTEEAARKLTYRQELLNQAQSAGIELTPDQVAELDGLASTMAHVETAYDQANEKIRFQHDLLRGGLADIGSALEDNKLDWNDLANIATHALDRIIDKIDDDLVDSILNAGSASSGGSGGGGLWDLISGGIGWLFGGGGSSDPWAGLRVASAKGNVFSAPALSAYRNTIVTQPTLFPFANGIGLMGEKPGSPGEAIMPLTRGPSGVLGVAAFGPSTGSGRGGPLVQIVDQRSGGSIQEQREVGPDGVERLRLVIRDEIADYDLTLPDKVHGKVLDVNERPRNFTGRW